MIRGSRLLRHGLVEVAVADGVVVLLPANPIRKRALMYNATATGTGSTVFVGHNVAADGSDLSEDNGWPLREAAINDVEGKYWQSEANVLELFTTDVVYALAIDADAEVRYIEELS